MSDIPQLTDLFAVPMVTFEELEADEADILRRRKTYIEEANLNMTANVAAFDGALHHVRMMKERAITKAKAEEEARRAAAQQQAEDETAAVLAAMSVAEAGQPFADEG